MLSCHLLVVSVISVDNGMLSDTIQLSRTVQLGQMEEEWELASRDIQGILDCAWRTFIAYA